MKPPTQTTNKEGTPTNGAAGRRTSLSQAQSAAYSTHSPSSRPGNRRRDSADLLQGALNSPLGNSRFPRDETNVASPPSSLLRRRTDLRDSTFGATSEDRESEGSKGAATHESSSPFGALKRTNTGPVNTGLNGPSSPWSNAPQSAGFAPMGTFGNFSLSGPTNQPLTPNDKKTSLGSLRGESRFRGLMNHEPAEETRSRVKEKASVSSLEQLVGATEQPSKWNGLRSAHLHADDDNRRTGSAALGGDDVSPPQSTSSRSRNPDASGSYDDIGFSSIGKSSDVAPFRELMQRRDPSQQLSQQYAAGFEPMSPTTTNPYQSPEAERAVPNGSDPDEPDIYNMQYGSGSGQTRGMQPQFESTSNDRSRTSSAGASRGFPNLNSLGNLSGIGTQAPWSAAPGAIGTPSRAQATFPGFGDSMFGALGELNSPSHTSSRFFDSGAPGTVGRGSKMGSLFPSAMQDQIRGEPTRAEQGYGDFAEPLKHVVGSNAPGFGRGLREPDNALQAGRLENLIGGLDLRDRGPQTIASAFVSNDSAQVPISSSSQPPFSAAVGTPSAIAPSGASYFGRNQEQDSAMPASQQRQMVMPDRMRWIYRDPQGNTQGPWSGLEMHDWYKAGFFSPELQVKKQEDSDYEPLAQLIRRIGNSREPFLVPQIGIPHGSSTQQPTVTAGAGVQPVATPSSAQPSSAQPPFASSFPSFGTTLTAEQQNALERRKQEEQYLMARQKEHLAQQQVALKQIQHMQGGPGQQLHHHSSAHSLQSQPSYGSITSPTGYQMSPAQGANRPPAAVPGFFESSRVPGPLGAGTETLSPVREDDIGGFMSSLNTVRASQMPFSGPQYSTNPQEAMSHPQQLANMLQERARLQREQEQYDLLQRGNDEQRAANERLDQFHMLRNQIDEQQNYGQVHEAQYNQPQQRNEQYHDSATVQQPPSESTTLTLSEQVQKAASAQPASPWTHKDAASLPQPFPAPPPQSASPLPAPAAQRRQNVADTLALESQSRTQTPSVETPSATVAPWARPSEPTETAKGPSLKEIQAIEARNAAQQEEIAAAARKALAKQENTITQTQQQHVIPAPGLPSSANWASGGGVSPAIPSTAGWAKPKTIVATPAQGKKTLAQIQKEEETRKMRAAAASHSATVAGTAAPAAAAGGKRYADLASKAALNGPQVSTTASNAWTTVGAGGKVKTPTTPSAPTTTATRTASAGPVAISKPVVKPAAANIAAKEKAQDEFQKWVKSSIGKQLQNGISGIVIFTSPTPALLFLSPTDHYSVV